MEHHGGDNKSNDFFSKSVKAMESNVKAKESAG